MSQITKRALEASLKKLLQKKPLDKITISDITDDCGISRMTFYYHFRDIYDLIEWACIEDAGRALEGRKDYDNWQEGLRGVFEYVLEDKSFILSVYKAISREQVEAYLYRLTYELINGVVEERARDKSLREEDKRFITEFYMYAFVGVMLDWVKHDMQETPRRLSERVGLIMAGSIDQAIERFRKG